jgi:hypothetical protein
MSSAFSVQSLAFLGQCRRFTDVDKSQCHGILNAIDPQMEQITEKELNSEL